MPRYQHLRLWDWPFQIVPDESYCTFLADRKQLAIDIRKLLRNLSRRDTSSIHILWAWFGAGKTHTLRHLSYRCKTEFQSLIPIYIEFPRATRSFKDLYSSLIINLDSELVQNSYLEVFTSPRKDEAQNNLNQTYPDLSNALKMLCMGGQEQQRIANYWLRGEKVPLRDLKNIGISSRIETDEQALQVITWLLTLINWAHSGSELSVSRILWMIDEFQRIENCRIQVQQDINGCLSSLFNRSPKSFSLFLSFTGPPSKKMPSWLSKELADRVGLEQVMLLPPLIFEEAEIFIRDVLNHFRDSNYKMDSTFPFTDKSIKEIIKLVDSKIGLKPRSILQACNVVLEEADMDIEEGKLSIIDASFVHKVLDDREFIETEE